MINIPESNRGGHYALNGCKALLSSLVEQVVLKGSSKGSPWISLSRSSSQRHPRTERLQRSITAEVQLRRERETEFISNDHLTNTAQNL